MPAGSFERLSSLDALWEAWYRYRRGKRRRPAVAWFDIDADVHLGRLHYLLRQGRYRPGPYRVQVIHDPKVRVVAAPAILDRVVHRALLDDIGPSYERGFIDHNYAVCTGRGSHRAILRYLRWTRTYRWRLSLDIRRYFPSVHHRTLLGLFARRLRDRRTIALIADLIQAGAAVYRTRPDDPRAALVPRHADGVLSLRRPARSDPRCSTAQVSAVCRQFVNNRRIR
ncbi:hypothetical protein [Haliangium sp.]|uniref:hypothetical protein n=1 Tax=Haliangium sp. TaxID=2663208 RepID=UPI003D0C020E